MRVAVSNIFLRFEKLFEQETGKKVIEQKYIRKLLEVILYMIQASGLFL